MVTSMNNPNTFNSNQKPLVSILILCFNKLEYTRACIEQLHKATPADLFELIVVDNASSDGTTEYLNELKNHSNFKHLHIISNKENLGFVGGNNQAAQKATSKYIVFLNNDTLPQPGWLEAMLKLIERDNSVGAVGAKLVYPDGRLQEAGGITYNDASGCNYGKYKDPTCHEYNFVRAVDYCSGACLLIRTDLFQNFGGFDTRFSPAYYEDTDLCFSLRNAGYQVLYQPDSVVVHFEGATAGTDISSGAKKYQAINKDKFIEKWGDILGHHPTPPNNRYELIHASERIHGKHIMIAHDIPQKYDRASGALRIHNLMRMLVSNGNHVTYCCLNSSLHEGVELAPYIINMQQMGVHVIGLDRCDNGFAELEQQLILRPFDVAFLPFYYAAEKFIPTIREMSPHTRIVIDSVDVHFLREARQMLQEGTPRKWVEFNNKKTKELSVYCLADAVLTVTEQDKLELEHYLDSVPVISVSDPHNAIDVTPDFDQRKDIMFLAGFKHHPNIDAALFFYNEIWPLVQKQIPGVRWFIVGDSPPNQILDLAGDNVVVTGYVPSVEPYLQSIRVAVVPIRFGAGMKGKIACALAQGLPNVSTALGAEGMGLQHNKNVLVADLPQQFADAVTLLYNNKQTWKTISKEGKIHLENTLGDSLIYPKFAKALHLNEAVMPITSNNSVAAAESISKAYKMIFSNAADLAEMLFIQALNLVPDSEAALAGLALACVLQNNGKDAGAIIGRLLSEGKNKAVSHVVCALIYSITNQNDEAHRHYREAVLKAPTNLGILEDAIDFMESKNDHAAALQYCSMIGEIKKEDVHVFLKIAELYLATDNRSGYISALTTAFELANSQKRSGLAQEIAYKLEQANSVGTDPPSIHTDHAAPQPLSLGSHASVYCEVAAEYIQNGETEKARLLLNKELAANPDDLECKRMLHNIT